MAALLIYMLVSGASYTSNREHDSLSDNGFAAACAAGVISLLATLAACCQLAGWVATFGELLRLNAHSQPCLLLWHMSSATAPSSVFVVCQQL